MSDTFEFKSASAESVALDITLRIAGIEKFGPADDEYRSKFLDLYSECLRATRGQRGPK